MAFASSSVAERPFAPATTAGDVSTIVYRSRAVAPLSDQDLQRLMRTAQARNGREGITGVVLYDERQFFQWLEGPEEGVKRVMGSIQNDRRHTDLEVLTHYASPTRRFSGWDMKLAARGANPALWQSDVLEPPRAIIDDLRRRPASAPSLLAKLMPLPVAAGDSPLATSLAGKPLGNTTVSILKDVLLKTVIPLLHHHEPAAADAEDVPVNPRAAELAELLVASDQAASLSLIRELRGKDVEGRHLFAPLFEPAARALGDLWGDDFCSEVEVTLGLCRIQTAVRLLGADTRRSVVSSVQPKVLIVPAPGELHQLVAVLDSEWLWSEGWSPQSEFPATDRALGDLLSASWIDVLDLSLSAAFRRKDSLVRLTETIKQARRASLNPALLVLVGGRTFVEVEGVGTAVGADIVSRTSLNVDRYMVQGMKTVGEGLHCTEQCEDAVG
ncbi:BLUF domain-containing protein [Roseomonas nepalensis]|uniref:BLUF domain-containing protein n=1 Tax=Muricoccus nepalensis TaxID=1854500 RepID=A0A502FAX1_9PROT|nr:BLUF domain-containing protein [Roseomonas nepalensis]TPG46471.1 BLUF domain-containing protein [Roseomonas nepalensis]